MPSQALLRQADNALADAKCPKCANTQGIRDGGPSLRAFRAYDLMHDTWGVMRCPHCGFRGGAAEFRKHATRAVDQQ